MICIVSKPRLLRMWKLLPMNSKPDVLTKHLGHAKALHYSTSAHSSAWEIPGRSTGALSLLVF